MALKREQLERFARIGAAARLAELEREREDLLRSFPDLRGTKSRDAEVTSIIRRRRKKIVMTAAQRKAVSERMKRYWAGRRKAAK